MAVDVKQDHLGEKMLVTWCKQGEGFKGTWFLIKLMQTAVKLFSFLSCHMDVDLFIFIIGKDFLIQHNQIDFIPLHTEMFLKDPSPISIVLVNNVIVACWMINAFKKLETI